MKDVKIIFIDLDGTLKDSNQRISINNKKIFEKLADKGVRVVFATGRSLKYSMSLSKQFSASSYIISSNGAEIYNYDRAHFKMTLHINNVTTIHHIIPFQGAFCQGCT